MDKLGKYEIRSVLGRGAMGTVYEGWDPIISRRVAIKTVRLPDSTDSEESEELNRFQREAQAAGRLQHVNVVGVYDYAETDELAYIVMEFVDGRTLKSYLDEKPAPPLPEVERLMDGLLAGLDYSHANNVIHRDIKPANIILAASGTVKIADFGIARIESSTMTQAGTIMGTPAYMSPEQFVGVNIDTRTDIYSAGVLLFQLLTGKRPFEGNMATIMNAVMNQTAPRPSQIAAAVPAALDAVVARAMSREPADRFATAAAFNTALKQAIAAPTLPSGLGDLGGDIGGDDATVVRPSQGSAAKKPAASAPVAQAVGKVAAQTVGQAGAPGAKKSALPLVLAGVAVLLAAGGAGAFFAFGNRQAPPTQTDRRPAEAKPNPDQEAGLDPARRQPMAGSDRQPGPGTVPGGPQGTPQGPADRTAQGSGDLPGGVPGNGVNQDTAQFGTQGTNPGQTTGSTTGGQTPGGATPGGATAGTGTGAENPTGVTANPPVERTQPVVTALVTPNPEAIRRAVADAIRATSCTLASGDAIASSLVVRGVSGQGMPDADLRAAVQNAAPAAALDWQVAAATGPYCGVLDTLRAYARPFGGTTRPVGVALANGRTALNEGELVLTRVFMPDYPAYLQLDYIASDGSVLHMHDATGASYPAAASPAFGEPKAGFQGWAAGDPFGTDIIIAVASSTPLFRGPRPATDTLDGYLRDLRAALDQASRGGARIAATAMVVQTIQKPH